MSAGKGDKNRSNTKKFRESSYWNKKETFARPATRGELRDRLNNGEACEVAAHVVEMTNILLEHWLNCKPFTVEESGNQGWVIYRCNV